jgi:hypothetical protein
MVSRERLWLVFWKLFISLVPRKVTGAKGALDFKLSFEKITTAHHHI